VIVPDEGAAEMVRAALVEAGIQPQFARARPDHPYHPTVFAEPWRVTVPAERLQDARNALARLEHDVAEEADAQARAWEGRHGLAGEEPTPEPLADAGSPGRAGAPAGTLKPDDQPLPSGTRRAPRLLTALALGFVLPFPVVCFYARARRLGAILLGLFVASVALAFAEGIWRVGLEGLVLLDAAKDQAAAEHVTHAPSGHPRLDARPAPDPNEAEPRTGLGALAAVEWISLLGLLVKLSDLGAGVGLIALERARSA
jgi:hypothetical protein